MAKKNRSTVTGQGVRNLNLVGAKPRKSERAVWTCPPHLPSQSLEQSGMFGERVRRCRSCGEVLEIWSYDGAQTF